MAIKTEIVDVWHPKMDLSKPDVLKKAITDLADPVKNGVGFLQFQVRMNHAEYTARFNTIQKYFMEQTRLGIPAISNGEGCHGFVGNEDKSTVFPVSPTLGSTWNPELICEAMALPTPPRRLSIYCAIHVLAAPTSFLEKILTTWLKWAWPPSSDCRAVRQ